MVVNTQQLQYLVEIQRTGSISHAAANLYMSQPNLSRVLRDMEHSLGYPIFERTRKGVHPTPNGEKFLHHARNILRETGCMEQLGSSPAFSNRLRICIPRSFVYMELVQKLLEQARNSDILHAQIQECHPRSALDSLLEGSAGIAILRCLEGHQDYFAEQAAAHRLAYLPLRKTEFQILIGKRHPLSGCSVIPRDKLSAFTEIIRRTEPSPVQQACAGSRRIYTIDRMAQLQLLQGDASAYLWSEPLPEEFLRRNELVQLPCAEGGPVYHEALVYIPQSDLSGLEKALVEHLRSLADSRSQEPPDISIF